MIQFCTVLYGKLEESLRNKQSRDHTCPKRVRRRKCQHLWVTTISVPVPKWKRRRSDSCASIPRFLTPISLHSHKYPFEATGSELPAITRGRKKSSVVVFLRTLSTAIFGSVVCNQTQQDEKFRRRLFAYTKLGDVQIGCLQSHVAGRKVPSLSLCIR